MVVIIKRADGIAYVHADRVTFGEDGNVTLWKGNGKQRFSWDEVVELLS